MLWVAIESVDVYIARDGVELGAFPRKDLNDLARAGELQPTDHYWYEGMPDWLLLGDFLGRGAWEPLPEPKPPQVPLWQAVQSFWPPHWPANWPPPKTLVRSPIALAVGITV